MEEKVRIEVVEEEANYLIQLIFVAHNGLENRSQDGKYKHVTDMKTR